MESVRFSSIKSRMSQYVTEYSFIFRPSDETSYLGGIHALLKLTTWTYTFPFGHHQPSHPRDEVVVPHATRKAKFLEVLCTLSSFVHVAVLLNWFVTRYFAPNPVPNWKHVIMWYHLVIFIAVGGSQIDMWVKRGTNLPLINVSIQMETLCLRTGKVN